MGKAIIEKSDSCGSIFRIQRKDDIKIIGFGDGQFERPYFKHQVRKILHKKCGRTRFQDYLGAYHWRVKNKGYYDQKANKTS